VLAPYIFHLLWTNRYKTALAWFAIVGITDALDGFVARRFGAQSQLGAYLDPVADKVLLSGTFVILAWNSLIPMSLAFMVLGRDLLILIFAGFAMLSSKKLQPFPPSIWGKLSTVAQVAYALLGVAAGAGYANAVLLFALGWITVGLTVWSGLDYARSYRGTSA